MELFARDLQVQERLTKQIADWLDYPRALTHAALVQAALALRDSHSVDDSNRSTTNAAAP